MRVNRNGWLETETQIQCHNCLELFDKTIKHTMTWCKKCNTARVKSQSAESKMYRRAKARSVQQGLEFTITKEDIVIPKTCPVLGIPLYCTSGKSGAFKHSPSLDKIDPSRGYVTGNVQVISQLANQMKHSASRDDLLAFAEWIRNNIK